MKGNAKTVKTISVIMLILAGMIWGGSFVVVKDSLDYITPLWQLALRLLVASVPAAVLAVINLNKWDRKSICHGAVLGVIFAAALIFQNKGMQYVSASKSAFLTGTYVAFLPVIEIVFLRRRVAARKIIAAVICTIGAAVLTLQGRFVPEWGDLSLLACGALYAVHLIYIDENMSINPILLHTGQIIAAAVGFLLHHFHNKELRLVLRRFILSFGTPQSIQGAFPDFCIAVYLRCLWDFSFSFSDRKM